jgi:hypothetical protein
MSPFYQSTCSLDELDEKPNHTKMSKSRNFERRVTRQRTHSFNHLIEKLCSMGSKCLILSVWVTCAGNNLAKKTCLVVHWNSFWDFLGFSTFMAINQNIHTQLCMNVKSRHCHMNYLKLD